MPTSFNLTLKMKIVTPFLGDIRTGKDSRKLNIKRVIDDDYWLPKIAQWRWAFSAAIESMGLDQAVDVDYVRFPAKIKSPKIRVYSRAYERNNPDATDMFECFSAGTVITFNVFVLGSLEVESSVESTKRPPTKDEIIQAFKIIGESIGLSPWGSKFDYGRFEILTSDQQALDDSAQIDL